MTQVMLMSIGGTRLRAEPTSFSDFVEGGKWPFDPASPTRDMHEYGTVCEVIGGAPNTDAGYEDIPSQWIKVQPPSGDAGWVLSIHAQPVGETVQDFVALFAATHGDSLKDVADALQAAATPSAPEQSSAVDEPLLPILARYTEPTPQGNGEAAGD